MIVLGIWAWFSTGPWTWLSLLNMHPALFLPLPIGYVDLCVNTLWQTGHTLLCGSLRRMLFLLACMLVKYGVLYFCRQAGSSLSTLHLHSLKGTLGVKQSTTNWAVLRECGHEPLQFYWFRSAVKLFKSMLNTNSDTLRRVVQADLMEKELISF